MDKQNALVILTCLLVGTCLVGIINHGIDTYAKIQDAKIYTK